MIPQEDLKYLKPLPEITKRNMMVKKKAGKHRTRSLQGRRFRPKMGKRDRIGLG